ncbi:MAG: septal ring lytic transglycosylase RlpA family protein [Betaproteobacteria bacterium]
MAEASAVRIGVSECARILVMFVVVGAVAACSTAPMREDTSVARKPGGYYLDDGPGANPPPNIEEIPDARPRAEPIKASTAKPYVALGQRYTPMTAATPYKARGLASWYGRRYHGKPTASGELYNMYAMTAAHPTLPIPSYARVSNVRSGKTVVVRINDRGPFHSDRLIDLSYAAAMKLGIVRSGSDLVDIESVLPGEATPASLPPATEATQSPVDLPAASQAASDVAPSASTQSATAGVYIQLGAFAARNNAEDFLSRIRSELSWLSESLAVFTRDGLYRVHIGPYPDREQASQVASRIAQSMDVRPVVISR